MKRHYFFIAAAAMATCAVASSSFLMSQLTPSGDDVTGEDFVMEDDDDSSEQDITSEYLANPSFESDNVSTLAADGVRTGAYVATSLTGWTLSGTYGVSDIMTKETTVTDNNFGAPGAPSDGSQMYYIRYAWNNASASLKQEVSLPAGKYRLTVDNKCVSASSHTAYLTAAGEKTSLTFQSAMPSAWITTSVMFELTQTTSVSLGVDVNFINASGASILLDNFRLYRLPDDYAEPEDPTEDAVTSYTEGVINSDFVSEEDMKSDLLQMLADFSLYMVNDWYECAAPNSISEACGYFNGEDSGANNEKGVRPNADLSMICAFLVKYAKPAGVELPSGVTYDKLEDLAMKSLVFAYSTHKANKLKVCKGNNYWGSTSTSDYTWESSLWAMSVAYSAYFQWDKLSSQQKGYIEKLLKAECNYELNRSIPTGYEGDTKAEENGWEADVLAATLGLFPDDALADKWFARMREMSVNSYSHPNDIYNSEAVDEWYDNKSVADLYKGRNLYDDFSLQNHNLFHTSYQNVVQQELGEAALALKMFQTGLTGTEKWKTNTLMHHNQEVQDSILNWLALADGELAMPNGNDWSLFLYDQITSYSTMACFLRDPNALMLENMAYKYIKARQKTTSDGSWLLRADVGARRMGVEAHRVMMTYLMHEAMPTNDMTPTSWDDFNKKYSEARLIPCQNIVRASSDYRFTCFSWSTGLGSYTGYFAANSPDKNKIVVPYRANNTGNLLGWYDVNGKSTNATPVVSGIYELDGNAYVMNGELNTNDASLNRRFAIYSTPTNALVYIDYVTALASGKVTADKTGLLAVSTDEFMRLKRTLYYGVADSEGNVKISHKQLDGTTFTTMTSDWVNVDNELGVVSDGGKKIAFGDRGANNSIYTSKLYPMYDDESRTVKSGDVVDMHRLCYYSLVDAEKTAAYASGMKSLAALLPTGWNGVIVPDEGVSYVLISNFKGEADAVVSGLEYNNAAPVFYEPTTVTDSKASVSFSLQQNHSVAQPLRVFVEAADVVAQLCNDSSVYVTAQKDETVRVTISSKDAVVTKDVEMSANTTVLVSLNDGALTEELVTLPVVDNVDYTGYIKNPSFDGNSNYGWNGNPTVNFNCAEKYNTTFDVYQIVTGLPKGLYQLTCQGFYRAGSYSNAASAHKAGTEKLNVTLYGNDSVVALVSIIDGAGKAGAVGVQAGSYGYVPNTMEQTYTYFRKGLYNNSLVCRVGEDGVLKLGVKKTTTITNDWAIFDNFTLTFLGEEEEDPEALSVGGLREGERSADKGIFTLRGEKVSSVRNSGIYVIDGVKTYVRSVLN